MYFNDITASSSKGAKRALISAASFTLIFASLDFTQNILHFLSLEILISPPKAIRAGQILTAFFLFTFLVREIPRIFEVCATNQIARSKIRNEKHISWMIGDIYSPASAPDTPEENLANHKEKFAYQERQTELLFDRLFQLLKALEFLAIDLAVPVVIAIIALSYPYALDCAVSGKGLFWHSLTVPCSP
ncbi:MAG: hypothetical protein ACSHWZ_16055 [Sulfitobacter sp.]